jgi:hypothetical protein
VKRAQTIGVFIGGAERNLEFLGFFGALIVKND